MQTIRQVAGSFLLAAMSAALVIGGISLALAEAYVPDNPTPTATQPLVPVFFSPSPAPISFNTNTPLPTVSETVPPPPTACPPPANWIPLLVQPGDNLVTLSLRYKTTTTELSQANCLFSPDLPAGSILYVPPIPTPTTVPCGPPANWTRYTVQPGNTMYSLSHAYGVSIPQLQFANCIPPHQYYLATGQTIWVPNVAVTRTPLATATATLTPVSIIFPASTSTPTATQTATTVPSPTMTNTSTPTSTPVPTIASPTASPTTPPTATATVTAFPSPTATSTPIP